MEDFSKRISALSPQQRALLELKLKKRGLAAPESQAIPRRNDSQPCVLSVDQERLWFIDQVHPGNLAYNIHSANALIGPLNIPALERAINEIVRRHEILRCNFVAVAGQPVQVIAPDQRIAMSLVDLRDIPEPLRDEEVNHLIDVFARWPYNLAEDQMMRAVLLIAGEDEHVLMTCMHHIVTDWWSYALFFDELEQLYQSFSEGKPSPLPELPIQYPDFAIWQRKWMEGEGLQSQIAYWKKQLDGAKFVLDLPTDRPRPAVQTFNGARQPLALSKELSDALRNFSARQGVSPFMIVLTLLDILYCRYSGQQDIIVASPSANRDRVETQSLIGYFLNLIMLRATLSGNPTFLELLGRVREATLGAFANQSLPFGRLLEELQPERDTSRNPVFQVVCVFLEAPDESLTFADLKMKTLPVPDGGASRFDQTFALWNWPSGMSGYIEYNTDLFDAERMRLMQQRFIRLVEAIIQDPNQRIFDISLLTEAERNQILFEWNDTATDYPKRACIHELFERQAAQHPEAEAVVFADQRLSYAELNRRANQLAHYLRAMGAGPETLIGICVERSIEQVIGLLGILKAGAAYAPLDPEYPLERLGFMLEDTMSPLIIASERLLDLLPSHWGQVVSIDADWDAIAEESDDNPANLATADNLAYVIYTSGSTGNPKGVSVTHRAVARLVKRTDYATLTQEESILQLAPVSFDASTFEIWGSLLNGGRLVVMPSGAASLEAIAAAIRQHEITTLWLTAGLFHLMVEDRLDDLKRVGQLLAGGDVLSAPHVKKVLEAPRGKLINGYGPTESTTFACCYVMTDIDQVSHTVPIGRPIANTRAYILDCRLRPAPVGVAGELHIGGDGLARGYLNQPALTAEKFIPDPFAASPGERMYKTGDLARYRSDGNIEFIGRDDFQVKVRGFRIEIGEVEAALSQHPGAQQVAVALQEDGPADKRLVAYIVASGEQPLDLNELRQFARNKLPEYMLPAAFVLVDEMPLTPNGKLDRRALPAPDRAALTTRGEFIAPGTATEIALAEIWGEVLGLPRVSVTDNFFDLGGDSIRTIQVLSKAQARGLSFSIHEVFQHPTIRGLAGQIGPAEIGAAKSGAVEPFSLISDDDRSRAPESVEDVYPLTRLQAGMLFHSEYSPETPVFHDIISFHIRAAFDVEAMSAAIRELIARHSIMRTSFDLTNFSEPMQIVHKDVALPLELYDLRRLSEAEQQEAVSRFVESEKARHFAWTEAPLFRFCFHRRSEQTFQFTVSFHHAILDGWSLSTLLTEMFQRYWLLLGHEDGAIAPPPASQFRDFVALEQAAIESEECQSYWREKLRDSSITRLPRWPAAKRDETVRKIIRPQVPLTLEAMEGVRRLASSLDVPVKSVLLAAHIRALGLVAGRDDVMTGLPFNGRPEERDGERVLGLFLNTLPLRIKLEGGSWAQLIKQTFEAEMQILPYRRYPLPDLQRAQGAPLFETAFNYTHFHVLQGIADFEGLEFLDWTSVTETDFAFLANFGIHPGSSSYLQLQLEYDALEFSEEQIDLMSGYYARTLEAMVSDPTARYETHSLLSGRERHQLLVEWNDTASEYPQDRLIHELFEQQSHRSPENIAVVFGDQSLSYVELNRRANQLAHHIQAMGASPDAPVGLFVGRSLEMIVGMLGILKAGAAYLSLDPMLPKQRLDFMLKDARVEIILAEKFLTQQLPESEARIVCLDADWGVIAQHSQSNPRSNASTETLAYVIYTSGSTGKPKAAEIAHRSVTRLLFGINYVELNAEQVLLQMAPLAFDASTFEVWGALLHGARLVQFEEEIPTTEKIAEAIARHNVTTMWLTASLFNAVIDESAQSLEGVRQLLVGGEPLSTSRVERAIDALESTRIINGYGPTESTTFACCYRIDEVKSDEAIPIGRPIANTRAYILDEYLMPVPVGVTGELHLGGAGLARGYLNRAALTAEKFIPDPFSDEPGARLYKSGDLARYRIDGNIEFIGRIDHQVKVRGFRIELGEIEAALRQHTDVREAVALARRDNEGDHRLVGYVVAIEGKTATAKDLRDFLRERLPEYMVPQSFVMLDSMPLTLSGKVDRRALPAPDHRRPDTQKPYVAPRTPVEELLAGIWAQNLGLEKVGIHDGFFEMGGHSLSVTKLVSQVRGLFSIDLPLRRIFDEPTVAGLAAIILEDPAERARVEKTSQLMLKLAQLSDDEAEAMLNEKLGRTQGDKTR